MPNWCSTSYRICDAPEKLKVLNDHFDKAAEQNLIKNDFGGGWLGNLLAYLGYDEEKVLSGPVRCRGSIVWRDYEEDGSYISIETETAWGPMDAPIMMMVEKYAPEATVWYQAMEPGTELYCSNDPDVVGTFHVDCFDAAGLPKELKECDCLDVDKKHLEQMLREALDRPTGELADLIVDAREMFDIYMHEWTYDDLDC